MKPSFKEGLITWVITTGLSFLCVAGGIMGQKAVGKNKTFQLDQEMLRLKSQLPKLAADALTKLENRGHLNPDIRQQKEDLAKTLADLKRDVRKLPSSDKYDKERSLLHKDIRETEQAQKDLALQTVEEMIKEPPTASWPDSIYEYQQASGRIAHIKESAPPDLRKKAIFLMLMGTVCLGITCVGGLGLFIFGICGLIGLVDTLD